MPLPYLPTSIFSDCIEKISDLNQIFVGSTAYDENDMVKSWYPSSFTISGVQLRPEPLYYIQYYDGYEVTSASFERWVELHTDYDYEEGTFRLSRNQYRELNSIYSQQARRQTTRAEAMFDYITKFTEGDTP